MHPARTLQHSLCYAVGQRPVLVSLVSVFEALVTNVTGGSRLGNVHQSIVPSGVACSPKLFATFEANEAVFSLRYLL